MTAMLPMLKALLADRFKLKVHVERREMPIYALVVARDDGRLGANITRSAAEGGRPRAAEQPGNLPPATPTPPSVMIALEEQLGLRLESTRGPVEILVIDSAALPEPD
jgi:hypothetical protein